MCCAVQCAVFTEGVCSLENITFSNREKISLLPKIPRKHLLFSIPQPWSDQNVYSLRIITHESKCGGSQQVDNGRSDVVTRGIRHRRSQQQERLLISITRSDNLHQGCIQMTSPVFLIMNAVLFPPLASRWQTKPWSVWFVLGLPRPARHVRDVWRCCEWRLESAILGEEVKKARLNKFSPPMETFNFHHLTLCIAPSPSIRVLHSWFQTLSIIAYMSALTINIGGLPGYGVWRLRDPTPGNSLGSSPSRLRLGEYFSKTDNISDVKYDHLSQILLPINCHETWAVANGHVISIMSWRRQILRLNVKISLLTLWLDACANKINLFFIYAFAYVYTSYKH